MNISILSEPPDESKEGGMNSGIGKNHVMHLYGSHQPPGLEAVTISSIVANSKMN